MYVDLPNATARKEILQKHCKKISMSEDVDLEVIANDPHCEGYSGADLAALAREASTAAMRRLLQVSTRCTFPFKCVEDP